MSVKTMEDTQAGVKELRIDNVQMMVKVILGLLSSSLKWELTVIFKMPCTDSSIS